MENKIIDLANELVKGRGDGRISEADMNIILENKLTSEEEIKTLFFIYENFKLTDTAKEKLYKIIFQWCDLYNLVKTKILS